MTELIEIVCKLKSTQCKGVRGNLAENISIRESSRGDIDKRVYCWKIREDKTCDGKGNCLYYLTPNLSNLF